MAALARNIQLIKRVLFDVLRLKHFMVDRRVSSEVKNYVKYKGPLGTIFKILESSTNSECVKPIKVVCCCWFCS